MRYPLDEVIVNVGGAFGVRAVAGTGLPDAQGVNRHVGTDLRARTSKPVRSPGDGTITKVQIGSSGNKILEVRIGDKDHRFLHLSKFVRQSGSVQEGELIAETGATGNVTAHLHWDVRRAGTAWNASFYNYVDPMSLIKEGDAMTAEDKAWVSEELNKRDKRMDAIEKSINQLYNIVNETNKNVQKLLDSPGGLVDGDYHIKSKE